MTSTGDLGPGGSITASSPARAIVAKERRLVSGESRGVRFNSGVSCGEGVLASGITGPTSKSRDRHEYLRNLTNETREFAICRVLAPVLAGPHRPREPTTSGGVAVGILSGTHRATLALALGSLLLNMLRLV